MSSSQTDSRSEPTAGAAAPTVAGDPSAQKRMAIGLAPRRPTATAEVQRPPVRSASRSLVRALAILLACVLVVTILLMVADTLGSPIRWPWDRSAVSTGGDANSSYEEIIAVEFDSPTETFTADRRPGQWVVGPNPAQGTFEVLAWPGYAAWATLGASNLGAYRIETRMVIASGTPSGYGGIVARFRGASNFYQFVIDGDGRFQVVENVDGVLDTIQPWTPAPTLFPSGIANTLAVEDDGDSLRFFANEVLLFSLPEGRLPVGDVGIAGGAKQDGAASIAFDWVRLLGQASSDQ